MNNLQVFGEADTAVQIHIVFALLAIVVTPVVIWRRQRDRVHKMAGYFWATAMAGTALSSFAISNFGLIGPFSPLHALAVLTLWTLFTTIRAAIRRDIKRHKIGLRNLATYGLGIPMVLNFLPDRTFTRAFFNENPAQGLFIMALLMALIVLWRLWVREDRPLHTLQAKFNRA